MCKGHGAYTDGINGAEKHKKVSHYTTIDSLKCILKNESLRLTRLDLVNDAYEEERTDDVWKGKIFTACFTYRETESNMFWNLYAKDNGVMLTFDNDFFLGFHSDIYADAACKISFPQYIGYEEGYERNEDYSDWRLRNAIYADVTYTSDFEKYRRTDTSLQSFFSGCEMIGRNNDFIFNLNPGLIKGIEWDSEQEVRIRAALSYRGLSNSPINGSPSTPFNYVYIPITDALRTMTVTMNPWHCDCFTNQLTELLRNNSLTENCEIKESSMREQVRR